MKELEGRTAVVTGGASGIGLALAHRLGANGMRVAIADVEDDALRRAAASLENDGVEVIPVRTDVGNRSSVVALADAVEAAFGPVHVLCNNAGVSVHAPVWELSEDDWRWMLGVNLWGAINGIGVFVPRMLAHGQPGHVLNTSSYLGVTYRANYGGYATTKHALTALTEHLYLDLRAAGAAISASVLIPKGVETNLGDSRRNRPDELASSGADVERMAALAGARRATKALAPPDLVAEAAVQAIKDDRFYVFSHGGGPENLVEVQARVQAMVDGEPPGRVVPA